MSPPRTAPLACLALAACAPAGMHARHTLYVAPRIVTGLADPAEVAGVEVDASGRVHALHVTLPEDHPAPRVELPGALALPGLHDAHIHLLGVGRSTERVDLRGSTSPAEVRARLAAFLETHPDASFLDGRGWDQTLFPEVAFPTAADLQGIDDLPVVLSRVDGHALWVNAAMLARAGIDAATPDPDGGRILRHPDGAPTGVLLDNAMDLARRTLPAPTDGDLRRWATAGARRCADAGLVAVHDMGMSIAELRALAAADADEPLPIRVFVYLASDDEATWPWLSEHPPPHALSPRVIAQGVKLVADGALGSRGAALLADYSDEPGHRGLLLVPPDELAARARRAHTLGAQVAIHAIGDRGNRVALDALAHALAAPGPAPAAPHRVEHAQVVSQTDIARFPAIGVVASMQPTHATSDMRWAETRVGPERLLGAYAWRTFLDLGVLLAFGSDAPVESERPFLGLHAATTRTDPTGRPAGGWVPRHRLSDAEAIRAFTATAAAALGRQAEFGTLEPGHAFDLTVVDRDPRAQPGAWLEARPVATVLDGSLQLLPRPLPGHSSPAHSTHTR